MSRSALFLVTVFATTTTQDSPMHGSSNANFSMVHKHEDLVVASVAADGSIHLSNSVDSGSPGSGSMTQYMTDSMDASTIGKMDTMVKKSTAGSAILDSNMMDSADNTDTNQMDTGSVVEIAVTAGVPAFAVGDAVVLTGLTSNPELNNKHGVVTHLKLQSSPGKVGVKVQDKEKVVKIFPEKLKPDKSCTWKHIASVWTADCGGGKTPTSHRGDESSPGMHPRPPNIQRAASTPSRPSSDGTSLKRQDTFRKLKSGGGGAAAAGAAAGAAGAPSFIKSHCNERVNWLAVKDTCWIPTEGTWSCSCLQEKNAYADCGSNGQTCKVTVHPTPNFMNSDCKQRENWLRVKDTCWIPTEGIWSCSCLKAMGKTMPDCGKCKEEPTPEVTFIDSNCNERVNWQAAKDKCWIPTWTPEVATPPTYAWSCSCLKGIKAKSGITDGVYNDCGKKGVTCK